MYALIDPTATEQYISSWNEPVAPSTKYTPVYTQIGQRVAYVEQTEFPVALPLFWYPCEDDVVADQFYFDNLNNVISAIPPNAADPNPPPAPPLSEGVQPA
jgi:hypothetical protein